MPPGRTAWEDRRVSALARDRFGVLVPVKPTRVAKSRLAPLGDEVRRSLVWSMAADTVTAALASPLVACVLAVTDDHRLAAGLREVGASVLPDGASDLNRSLTEAAAELLRLRPDLGVASLCADLPALRPEDLTRALAVAARFEAAFVADAAGSGTTMVTARSLETFLPRYGPRSRAEHRGAGLHEIVEVDVPTLRHDVDTADALAVAASIGVGARTAAVLERHTI